jgi:hypothetical protein
MTDTMTVPLGSSLLAGPRIFSQVAIDACITRLWAVIGHALRADRGDEAALDLFNDKVRELDYHAYVGKDAEQVFLAFRDLWNGRDRRNTYMRDLLARDKYTNEPMRVIFIVPDSSEEYEAFMLLDCCGALSLLGIE